MTRADPQALIGIDGGGTACRIALHWQGQMHHRQLGPANAFTDLDGTIATLIQGLEGVAVAAGLDLKTLADIPAHIGLAGVITPQIANTIATRMPLSRATISDDRSTAVVGALGMRDGTVVSIGTGSFLARQRDGSIHFAGGYGLTLGDEASGAWLGRALLMRQLHVADGLAAPSALTEKTFARFDNETAEIIRFAARATPQDFGTFAPAITKAAAAGDTTAVALMAEGADYITCALDALGCDAAEPLVLLGGVARHYQPLIGRAVTSASGSALDGALTLAARQYMGAT